MKVIYILLVSLIWVNGVAAQAKVAAPAATKATEQGLSTLFIISAVIFFLVLAGITLILALKISGSRTEDQIADLLAKQKRDLKRNESNTLSAGNNRDGLATQNEVKALMERINDLENMVRILREKSETPVAPPPAVAPPKEVTPIEEPPPAVEPRKEIFFLSTPNLNGSFNETSASSTFREGASIYKFTKESFNKATFCIDEREASIKLALQYPDKSIDPVCEALNAYNAKATKIVTKKPGTAELQGDKWVIQTKAKISYEG